MVPKLLRRCLSQLTGNVGQAPGEESVIQTFSSETLNYEILCDFCLSLTQVPRGEGAEAGNVERLLG